MPTMARGGGVGGVQTCVFVGRGKREGGGEHYSRGGERKMRRLVVCSVYFGRGVCEYVVA